MKKPIQLRIIFILNALMMILPFVFYTIITTKNITIEGIKPIYMVYTGIAYILSFAALVGFILKKNITGLRVMILINVLIALPTKAYIGIAVAIISIVLSLTGRVKTYFKPVGVG